MIEEYDDKHPDTHITPPGSPLYLECQVKFCKCCGWWLVLYNQIWKHVGYFYGAGACLKNLDLCDINQPLEEVQNYLTAKYDLRYSVNPSVFEDVVGGVFSNLGFKTEVTGRIGDEGIDAILTSGDDKLIGVQVKRYRNSIEAEQIRSFLGALKIGNYTEGVYVTTSRYRKGAVQTAEKAKFITGTPIKLYDAGSFLDLLKVSQKKRFEDYEPIELLSAFNSVYSLESLDTFVPHIL